VPIFWTPTLSASKPFQSLHRPDAARKPLHMASHIPTTTVPVPRPKQPRIEPNQCYTSGSYEFIGHGLNCDICFENDRPLDLQWLLVKCSTCRGMPSYSAALVLGIFVPYALFRMQFCIPSR
jgi:hypothetical protein